MSESLVKEQIQKFLKSDTPEVLVIKGRWGIGKTFNWNRYLKMFKEDVALGSYSYVSLFGLNSLTELKQAVFENKVAKAEIGEKPSVSQYAKKYTGIFKDLKIPVIGEYVDGIGSVISSISYLSLNKMIICFDDLERCSEGLSIKDFLGMVSSFKEQKDCKVVILLNEDADDLEDYFTYKEKVIDKHLHFEPTSEKCFESAAEEQDKDLYKDIRKLCISLDIKNIRVIRKIGEHVRDVLHVVSDYHEDIKKKAIDSTVILSWCYYSHSSDTKNIPTISFAKERNKEGLLDDNEKKKQWERTLSASNYLDVDELDLVISESIEKGFVNKKELNRLCLAREYEIKAKLKNIEYSKAWDLFHASFDDNSEEIVTTMEAALKVAVHNISSSQYSKGIQLIRDLGSDERANALVDYFIDKMKDKPERLNLKNLSYNSFSLDDDVFREKINEAYEKIEKHFDPMVILNRYRGDRTYNSVDAELLGSLTKEKLKEMFKSFKGDDLFDYINVCLTLGSGSKKLKDNTKQVLIEIGNESPLNKIRLEKFKI